MSDKFKLVPAEPDQLMCQAGQEKAREWPSFPLRITSIYKAMLAAAPKRDAEATPFANCRYRICDLPGQCRDEGHCHHPARGERGAVDAKRDYLTLAREAGLMLRIDGKFGNPNYMSVTSSWPALVKFADLVAATPQPLVVATREAVENISSIPSTDADDAKALLAFDNSVLDGYKHDVESYTAGYIDSLCDTRVIALTVWYGSMPESNGKTNWTAILHRGDISTGHTIDRSEYPDRVRYEADRVRWLIGEIEKEPWILDFDADKRSDYVAPRRSSREAFEAWAMDFYGCDRAHVDHFAGVDGYVIWQASPGGA